MLSKSMCKYREGKIKMQKKGDKYHEEMIEEKKNSDADGRF